MIIPAWVLCGITAAICIAFMPIYQERVKADGFSVAFWNKVFCTILALPIALAIGMPTDPVFYAYMAGGAALWCISDIIYFRAVPIVGAGVMTRLIPGAMLVTFWLWFIFKPDELTGYLENPLKFAAICATMGLAAFSAVNLRSCAVSMQAVRIIWFILFAACIGPIITKLGLAHTEQGTGPFATLLVQSAFMVLFWLVYYAVKRPVTVQTLFSKLSLQAGFIVSLLCGVFIVLKTYALDLTDNPAFVSVLLFTDAFWVLLIYKIMGRKEEANVLAGLGIVISATALVLVKSLM